MSSHTIIETQDLTKVYGLGDASVTALNGVSMKIDSGEFVAIMGPSGSGKSTLMHILGCLSRPSGGHYILDSQDVSNLDNKELAAIRNQKIGFVFQGFNLLARTTALENTELPMMYGQRHYTSREMRRRALHSLEIVGLSERADHFPNQLSGGQQQRVAIARALANEPGILLADEPTGNLDSKTSVEVMGVFQQLNEQGITIIMVTHELDIARYCKRNLVLRDGRLVRDELVPNRLDASVEMKKLKDAEAAAELTSG
jgi:putative ABC transport system ATP-binding protein